MSWLLALAIGLALGFVLHRGDFCMATALRSAVAGRTGSAAYAYLLALAIDLVAVRALADAGVAVPGASRSLALGAAVGGLALGAGMVLGRSCMLSVWSRAGTGSLGSLATAAAIAISAITTMLLWPADAPVTLAPLVGPAFWLAPASWAGVVAALVAIALALWWLPAAAPRNRRWPWPLTGVALGLIGALAWLVAAPGGAAWGLSLVPPSGVSGTARGATLAWPALIAVGIVAGAWVSADLTGGVVWRIPEGRELARRLAGGALMGAGAVIGSACSAGQALTGLSTLSLNAVVGTGAIVLGGKFASAIASGAPGDGAPTGRTRSPRGARLR